MELSLRHICGRMIELTVEDGGTTITTEITKLNGMIEDGLIENLQDIVEELMVHDAKTLQKL